MADDFDQIGNFLSRWSRRKLEKSAPESAPAPVAPPEDAAPPAVGQDIAPQEDASPPPSPPEPLPPVDSLTPESDFTRFMQPGVDPGTKSAALKQLFKDSRFNVMDGLDTYIEDYSVPDPIPAGMLKTMYQAREHLFSEEEKALADAADAADAEARAEEEALGAQLGALGAADEAAEAGETADAEPVGNSAQSGSDPVTPSKDA